MTYPSVGDPFPTVSLELRSLRRRQALSLALFCFFALASFSLAKGYDWIGVSLPGGVAAGTWLAILALPAGPLGTLLVAAPGTRLRFFSRVSFGTGLLWFPCSLLLSGNTSLVFRSGLGAHWLLLTVVAGLMSLVSVLWGFCRLVRVWRRFPPRVRQESRAVSDLGADGT